MSVGGVTERQSISRTPEAAATSRPTWLKSRRAAQPSQPANALPMADDLGLSRPHGFVAWVKSVGYAIRHQSLGWGMGVSLAIHGVLLVVLALIVFDQHRRDQLELNGVFGAPGDETILDLPLNAKIEPTGAASAPLEFLASTAVSDNSSLQATSDRILGALDGTKEDADGEGGAGGGIGAMSHLPVPESAVTKGSFTVFTDPEDPLPRQRYNIIIQIKLPKSVKQYRLRDLTGEVRGTDSFYKQIRYSATERRGVKDGVVQLEVSIPGAVDLVKDTIRIKSVLLKEEQTIEIVF